MDCIIGKKLDKKLCEKLLLGLPDLMEMVTLSKPMITKGLPNLPGYTGFIIIAFSHISFHEFSDRKRIWIDILSCRPFSVNKVLDYLKELLDIKSIRYF